VLLSSTPGWRAASGTRNQGRQAGPRVSRQRRQHVPFLDQAAIGFHLRPRVRARFRNPPASRLIRHMGSGRLDPVCIRRRQWSMRDGCYAGCGNSRSVAGGGLGRTVCARPMERVRRPLADLSTSRFRTRIRARTAAIHRVGSRQKPTPIPPAPQTVGCSVQFPRAASAMIAPGVWLKALCGLDGIPLHPSHADPATEHVRHQSSAYGPNDRATQWHGGTWRAALTALVTQSTAFPQKPKLEIVAGGGQPPIRARAHVAFKRHHHQNPTTVQWTWRLPPDNLPCLCASAEVWMKSSDVGYITLDIHRPVLSTHRPPPPLPVGRASAPWCATPFGRQWGGRSVRLGQ